MLTVKSDGSGTATWRVYQWCSEAPPPCDGKDGSNILDGGNATFQLQSVAGDVAQGVVTSSTDRKTLAEGPITLHLQPGAMLRVEPWGIDFCALGAAPSACGA